MSTETNEIPQPQAESSALPSMADLTKATKKSKPEKLVENPTVTIAGQTVEMAAVEPEAVPVIAGNDGFDKHVARIIALEAAEDATGNCPVCGFDICTKVATVDGKPLLKCHHCDSLWRPDEPTEKLKVAKIFDTLTIDGGLAHVGNFVQELQEISDSMQPGDTLHIIGNRYHVGQTLDLVDYQHFSKQNPRVIPTKDGLALAARYVGFELVDFQSPAISVRKPVKD